ncbi:MAG: acyl-CoA dehydrogenase family protein [Solirubrobacteraceae bacterium]
MLTQRNGLASDSEVLGRVRDLAGEIADQAAASDRTGTVASPIRGALTEAGCLRMAVAASYGGDDLALPAVLAVLEQLAAADASVGWLIGQAALSQVMIGDLPSSTLDVIYGDGPDVWVAGAAAPEGRASVTGDGLRVSGRWPLVPGCPYAAWIFLSCAVVADPTIPAPADGPRMRLVVLPVDEAEIIETWDALGLRATASHDVQLRGSVSPAAYTCELEPGSPDGTRMSQIGPRALGGPVVAACALGAASAAIDDLTGVTPGRRCAVAVPRLGDSARLRERLGDAVVTLQAARALLHREAVRATTLATGAPLAPLERARLSAAAVKAIEMSMLVTEGVFALGGSSSVLTGAPLERRLRDVRTAAQHFAASRDVYAPLGALLAGGQPVPAAHLATGSALCR